MTDRELLENYAETGDLHAFNQLLDRHVGMVHAAAQRQAPQAADDVVQAVFLLLARKADKIARQASISGWLYRTVGYCCANLKKTESRRRYYEREAAKMTQSAEDESWEKLLPTLDQALSALGPTERDAVVLHHLEAKSIDETARELGTSASTAAKRASRGIQKLRRYFLNRGYAIPDATVGKLISREAAKMAPPGVVTSTQSAIATGGSAAVVSLMKGTQTTMTLAKVKSAAAVTAGTLFLCATAAGITVVVQNLDRSHSHAQQTPVVQVTPVLADAAPPRIDFPTTEPARQGTPLDTLRTLCLALEANDRDEIFQCLCDDGKDPIVADLGRSAVRSFASSYHIEKIWKEKFGIDMKVSGFDFEDFPAGNYITLFRDTMNKPGGPEITIESGIAKIRVSDPPEAFAGTGPDRAPDKGRWSGAMLVFDLVNGDWKLNTDRTFNFGMDIDRIDGNRTDIMQIARRIGRGVCDNLDSVAAQIEDGTIKNKGEAVAAVRSRMNRTFQDAGVDRATIRMLPVIGG